jgi:ABC-type multidrug transport system permease subunit
MFRERAVLFRETMSRMYTGSMWAAAHIVAELPFLAFSVAFALPMAYFMIGLSSSAADYFFYFFTTWLFATVMASLAHVSAALFPSPQPAQMVTGLVIPLIIVYSGVYVPTKALPEGLQWAPVVDPMSYVVKALVPVILHCTATDGSCPTVQRQTPTGPITMPVSTYLETLYDATYDARVANAAYLLVFVGILQTIHMLLITFKSHVKR